MSSPKLLRILDAVAKRVESIRVKEGFYSDAGRDVRKTQRDPQHSNLPCAIVYLGDRELVDGRKSSQVISQQITVVVFRQLKNNEQSHEVGIWLLADTQRAVETDDNTLGGLLSVAGKNGGLSFQGDAVYEPEIGVSAVAAAITYAIPHIRKTGDPEIA